MWEKRELTDRNRLHQDVKETEMVGPQRNCVESGSQNQNRKSRNHGKNTSILYGLGWHDLTGDIRHQ